MLQTLAAPEQEALKRLLAKLAGRGATDAK
jgi:hypothetical protein